jgi:prolipoprotein diacylglyceryltransferase
MFEIHRTVTGLQPTLFGVPSYSLFVALGFLCGLTYYFFASRKRGVGFIPAFTLVAAALVFALIGSKIPLLFLNPGIKNILWGKSVVGALLGGMAGVFLAKKHFHIQVRMGNEIAPAVALGMAVGRWGCFFGGCCYGQPAAWGFDFGDGLLRLPTQLFEVAFHLTAFVILLLAKRKPRTPGILFKWYILSYFIFRFWMEFIRETPVLWAGLTIYQIICALGALYMAVVIVRIKREGSPSQGTGGMEHDGFT